MQDFEIAGGGYNRYGRKKYESGTDTDLLDMQENIIPQEVIRDSRAYAEILDAEYGMERDVDKDDGGYVLCVCRRKIWIYGILYHRLLKSMDSIWNRRDEECYM